MSKRVMILYVLAIALVCDCAVAGRSLAEEQTTNVRPFMWWPTTVTLER